MRSADPDKAAKLAAISAEKGAIWRGYTNAAFAPKDEPLARRFLQNKAFLDARASATPNFPDAATEFTVRPGHVLCFGDNTMNSSDSRMWGVADFPEDRIVGCSGWVFWPLSPRWGWGAK
jgi:hypothetical protein